MNNPYAISSDLPIVYAGYIASKDSYAYRIKTQDSKALESCMFQMKVSQWLFDNLMPDEWTMGNDTTGTDLENEGNGDVFVTLQGLREAAMFSQDFSITGLTPEMLV